MLWTKFVEKIKTHILSSMPSFSKVVPFRRECGKMSFIQTVHK